MKKLLLYIVSFSLLPNILLANISTDNQSTHFNYYIHNVPEIVLNALHVKLKELQKPSSQLTTQNVNSHYLTLKEELYNTLHALGYFRAKIRSYLENNQHDYSAHYSITLGPVLTITDLNIQLIGPGQQDRRLQKVMSRLALQKGCVMSTETYQMIKRALYKAVIDEGYLDATWKQHEVIIDREKYEATIHLILDTKHQYILGPVNFLKNPLNSSFLKRYIHFSEKAPYRVQDVQNLKTTLKNTGYFQKVTMKSPLHASKHEIPIQVAVVPAPKHYHALRLGYSRGLGFRLKAEKCIRYLNDRGHQAAILGQYSSTQPISISTRYTIPGLLPAHQQYHIQYEYNQHILANVATTFNTLGLSYVRQYLTWILTPSLKYHYEIFPESFSANIFHHTHLLIPGFTAHLSKINWLEASHNYEIHLHTQAALKACLSKINLFSIEYKLNYFGEYSNYFHFWKKYSYFVLRARLGYTFIPALQKTPPSLALYAGGFQYPRGHPEYKAPTYLLAGTLEYRHRLSNLLYLNFFTDLHPNIDSDAFNLKSSSGIGLALWNSTIGIAEISLVHIKSDHSTGRQQHFNFLNPYNLKIILRISDAL